ncbi:MAG: response regulator transcription factor [Gammaproteobacteria bacterium]
MRIALLEDDKAQAELIQTWLETAGHNCRHASNGETFIKLLGHESFDLLIIDWELPGMSGIEVLQWVRNRIDWPVPVLFSTSRDNEHDIVEALEKGADDYMIKPIKRNEMLARIHALARRSQIPEKDSKLFDFGMYRINDEIHQISREGGQIELTEKEYQLAFFLFRNAGRLVSRGHLLETIWGQSADINTRTVDTHVSRIRQKLQLGHASGWRLASVYQHGYRLERIEPD